MRNFLKAESVERGTRSPQVAALLAFSMMAPRYRQMLARPTSGLQEFQAGAALDEQRFEFVGWRQHWWYRSDFSCWFVFFNLLLMKDGVPKPSSEEIDDE